MRSINRKVIIWVGLVAAIALLAGCTMAQVIGSGRETTESRAVSDFEAVEFAAVGDVIITQGEEEGLTISGDDNILPLIKTEVSNGVLRIFTEGPNGFRKVRPLRYDLRVKDLRRVTLAGMGNMTAPTLTTGQLAATVSGAGNLQIDALDADALQVTLSGLGSTTIRGDVDRQEVILSGAGDYDGADLRSAVAAVTISGAGDAQVWATENLDATISGAGSIEYTGNPQVTQQVSGVGSVKAAEE